MWIAGEGDALGTGFGFVMAPGGDAGWLDGDPVVVADGGVLWPAGLGWLSRWFRYGNFTAMSMNADALLSEADQKEALSRAYVEAVAACAGYTFSEENLDRGGVDLRVHAGGYLSPSIGLQLKATSGLGLPDSNGDFRFDLPVKNYNRLVAVSQIPRYLVVLILPDNRGEWLSVDVDAMVLRKCCYWVSLEGLPKRDNLATVRVMIPSVQIFDVAALITLIDRSRRGV